MIYEVRTYDLKPGAVPQAEEAFAEALPYREKYSPIAAFWHTEIGPLNQIIHVWGYE
ncbi:MAG: NIPSNAP family protein, partial [Chloroflexi bacterium]|nr:NIPSNAP family protein [Chloroflexota bacterium]